MEGQGEVNRCVDTRIEGCTDRGIHGSRDARIEGCTDRGSEGCIDGPTGDGLLAPWLAGLFLCSRVEFVRALNGVCTCGCGGEVHVALWARVLVCPSDTRPRSQDHFGHRCNLVKKLCGDSYVGIQGSRKGMKPETCSASLM